MQEEKANEAKKKHLNNLLETFLKTQKALSEKLKRHSELTSRVSSKKWSDEKKKKMSKRFDEMNREFNQTFDIISQIQMQLDHIN